MSRLASLPLLWLILLLIATTAPPAATAEEATAPAAVAAAEDAASAVEPAIAGTPADEVVRWLEPHLAAGRIQSAVVAHVTADTLATSGHGRTDIGAEPDAATRYPIGSVTKVFTNLLLQAMAADGLVSPLDTLGALLPDGVEPQNPAVAGIRLVQLATHTSGLPRMPVNFFPRDPAQPFADYDADRLWEGIALARRLQPLGVHHGYSNLGLGLLGHLLGRIDGRGYCAALTVRVLAPRGLDATGCEPGDATTPWRFQALAGAGVLWSSAGDLARLVRQTLAAPAGDPALDVVGTRGGQELTVVWQVARAGEEPVYWHNGSIGHAQAFVGLRRDTGTGLVVLVAGEADPTASALQALGGRWARPAPLPPGTDALHGQYQVSPMLGVGVYESSGQLVAQVTGQAVEVLQPVGDDWWTLTTADASLHFLREADGTVTAVEVVQNGRALRAQRTAPQADAVSLQEIDLPAATLADYAGRYRLGPQMIIEVDHRDTGLWVQLTGQPALPVYPFETDGFFYRAVDARLHFARGADGEVTAVVLHQGGRQMRAERE